MFKRVTLAAAFAAFATASAGAAVQDPKPQEKPKETTVVIKDDATPKAKAAAKKTADATKKAAKKVGDAVKDTDVKVKNDVPDTKVVIKDDTKQTTQKVEDAAITSAVKTKLLGDTKVGGLKIDVDTSNHVVTLTGRVKSEAEKAEAIRLASTTKGVSKVVDKLTIVP